MSKFKPSLTYRTFDSIRLFQMKDRRRDYVYETFPSYTKLKTRIRNIFKHENPIDGIVSVSRSRRGEWGEWFEDWRVVDGKPKIVKEGWM